MISFGKFIAKHKKLIILLGVLLLIPSVMGYVGTKVNYDILSYLPEDIETVEGQNLLVEQFGIGAFSMVVLENMPDKDVVKLKEQIKQVEHVKDVIWYDDILDLNVPISMLPDNIREVFYKDNATLLAVLFDDTTSGDGTLDALVEIRKLASENCFVSGFSGIIQDTKELSQKETVMYVVIAAICSIIVLGLFMDSFIIPVLFLLSIGMAIIYNLGSNIILGEISFITQALTAALQLGVTMDYSIFLLHSYERYKSKYVGDNDMAMAYAISDTVVSVVSSSITTVAGFLSLCFMTFTLGLDLGIVMAKGVVFGVICCITILPALILVCDKLIEKTRHKSLLPDFKGVTNFVCKHYIIFAISFVILFIPAIYGNNNTKVYYNLDASLPKDLASIVANEKLEQDFNMNTTHMVLVKNDVLQKDVSRMLKEMEDVDGVAWALGLESIIGPSVPMEMIPDSITSMLKSEEYQLVLVSSEYKTASDEVNAQIDELKNIIKKYSDSSMLIGEAPLTKDLIDITAIDFNNVNIVSIGVIFIIILIVFKSISIPVILVSVIELAIFINMGIPFFTGTVLPFIASVVIGTIQLGATVDYAILMTTKYKEARNSGKDKKEAVVIAHQGSIKSVIVSGLSFFAATFGIGVYSSIDMISSLCSLMSRGAIISMFVVLLILPSMFMIFDKLICKTSIGFGKKKSESQEKEAVS